MPVLVALPERRNGGHARKVYVGVRSGISETCGGVSSSQTCNLGLGKERAPGHLRENKVEVGVCDHQAERETQFGRLRGKPEGKVYLELCWLELGVWEK